MAIETLPEPSIPITTPLRPRFGFLTATPIIATATFCLVAVALLSILAPWIAPHDPLQLLPAQRLKPASEQFLLGTDAYGRDVLSRWTFTYNGPNGSWQIREEGAGLWVQPPEGLDLWGE